MNHEFDTLEEINEYLNSKYLAAYFNEMLVPGKSQVIEEFIDLLRQVTKHDPHHFDLTAMIKLNCIHGTLYQKILEFRKWSIKNTDYVYYLLEGDFQIDDLCLDEDVFNLSYSYLKISENSVRYNDLILAQLRENPEVIRKNINNYLPMLTGNVLVKVMSTLKLLSKDDPVGLGFLLTTRASLQDYLQINDATEAEAIHLFLSERKKIFLEPYYHDLEFDRYVQQLSEGYQHTNEGRRIVLKEIIKLRHIQFKNRPVSRKKMTSYYFRRCLLMFVFWTFFEIPFYARSGLTRIRLFGRRNV